MTSARARATWLMAALRRLRPSHWLLLLLIVSYGLRLGLAAQGGQGFFGDESRFQAAADIAHDIRRFNFGEALHSILIHSPHPGARAAFTLPALAHRLVYPALPNSVEGWDQQWEHGLGDYRLSGAFMALASVASIGLVYAIVRRAGGDETEALLAAFLLAASNSWFMYSRHLLPYDISLFLALLALWVSIGRRAEGWARGTLVGVLLCCAFFVYLNHWLLVGVIGLCDVFACARSPRQTLTRLLQVAVGCSLPFLVYYVYNAWVAGIDVWRGLTSFAGTVTQGNYAEGVIFAFRYFGDAEGGMALLWALGIGLAAWQARRRRLTLRHRAVLGLLALLAIYATLAILSTGLEVFALYGRTARIVLPFVALVCAWAFAPFLRGNPARLAVFVAVVSAVALSNFAGIFALRFPAQFVRQAMAEHTEIAFTSTIDQKISGYPLQYLLDPDARYKVVNAFHPAFPIGEQHARPDGKVLRQASHPLNWPAFQYEGMSPKEREMLSREPLTMWLIDSQADEG